MFLGNGRVNSRSPRYPGYASRIHRRAHKQSTYQMVCTKTTGHAEAIEIEYDKSVTSYRALLEFFFQIHDPTTLDRQGNDMGDSYRSEIFAINSEQETEANDVISKINASGHWPGKVVTKVSKATDFWEAEPEHQNYLQRYPRGYTCHFLRDNWILPKS